jgi:hypothetical protein
VPRQFRTVARLAPKNGAAQAYRPVRVGLKDYDRSLSICCNRES